MQPNIWMQDSEVSFPNLHTLSLRNDGVPFTEDHFWNAIRDAPLRYFTTDEVQQCVSIGANHTPWNQLKSLTIYNLDGSMDFRFIVTHCLQLEELLMGMRPGFPGEDWSGDIQPVVLPSLRKLDLRSGSKPQFCFVLDSLVLPSLQIFHATVLLGEQMVNLVFCLDSLFSMLQRSADFGSLKELHLLDLPWDRNFSMKWYPTLLRILEHSPCLESLKVSFQRPYTAVYPRNTTDSLGDVTFIASLFPVLLIPSSRSQALLPRLRDIEIHEHLESCGPQLSIFILEMVEERTRAKLDANARADVSALKNVFICTDPLHQCWKQTIENPLSVVQERLVALGNAGTICRIYSKRKVEISGKQ
ncbi:hypothetical protein VNI00_015707 [Paramarasmius palmivorus]|uniref:Uncharacterized protein n=1 Tax=Paramarasmius palmivorus TaxID=297713 RepID=A0AAW0BJI0_9AGAR